jgi:hypothetical protein
MHPKLGFVAMLVKLFVAACNALERWLRKKFES